MKRIAWTGMGFAALAAFAALVAFVALAAPLAAQDRVEDVASAAQLRSGILHQDVLRQEPPGQGVAAASRSVPMAFGMSLALPGLGQAYNRNWIRSAAAAALEGGLLVAYFTWKDQGREGERAYQAYAHRFWDPRQYASWLNDYATWLEAGTPPEDRTLHVATISPPSGINFGAPETWTEADRQIVQDFFDAMRAVEQEIWHPETGAAFSHEIPYFGEQQYYELIGKYYQFAPGWVDYPAWKSGEDYTGAIDPERTGANGSKPNVQGRFLEYAGDHAHANTLLRRASRASAFLVLNHVLAAFDAAIAARLHNRRLETRMAVSYAGSGPHRTPTWSAAITWRF